jgi:hypothetical protein
MASRGSTRLSQPHAGLIDVDKLDAGLIERGSAMPLPGDRRTEPKGIVRRVAPGPRDRIQDPRRRNLEHNDCDSYLGTRRLISTLRPVAPALCRHARIQSLPNSRQYETS